MALEFKMQKNSSLASNLKPRQSSILYSINQWWARPFLLRLLGKEKLYNNQSVKKSSKVHHPLLSSKNVE